MRGALCAALLLAALPLSAGEPELAVAGMTKLADDVFVAKVEPSLWVFTTTGRLDDGTVVPANGMLLETPHGSVIVDPGWDESQARTLLDWAQKTLKEPVVEGIVTHSHRDRTGGAPALAAAHVPVVAMPLTAQRADAAGLSVAFRVLPSLTRREKVPDALGPVLLFPGPGHAPDNVVVYFPKQHVLYGGCFVKSVSATDLGNVADASLPEWPHAIAAVRRAFPGARLVVPGHGAAGGDALGRTEELLRGAKRK